MFDAIKMQESCMSSIKTNLKSISTLSPTIGRLGAFPVATIDVLSTALSVQVEAIRTLALSIFYLVKAVFAKNKMAALKDSGHQFLQFSAYTLLAPILALLAPIAIIDQTIQVIKDPVKNSHYRSNFSFK